MHLFPHCPQIEHLFYYEFQKLLSMVILVQSFAKFGIRVHAHPADLNHNNPVRTFRIASALYDLFTDIEYEKASYNIVPCYREHSEMNITSLHQDRPYHRSSKDADSEVCHFPQYGGDVNTEGDYSKECPWRFEIDYNEWRIPPSIAMAVCECQHCHRGRCVPIFAYVPALTEECDEHAGLCGFRKYVLEVPVGCSCEQHRRADGTGSTLRRHPCRRRTVMEV